MIQIKDVTLQNVNAVIVPVHEDGVSTHEAAEALKKAGAFSGKAGEVFVTTEVAETVQYMIYVGVGKAEEVSGESFRRAIAAAMQKAKALKVQTVGVQTLVSDKICTGGNVKAIAEAVMLATYSFDKYKSKEEEAPEMEVFICGVPEEKLERASMRLEETIHVAEGVIVARNLVNEPSNVIYPETLADTVVNLGEEVGFEVEVMDEDQIEELNMQAFLAVGRGSEHKPRLIVMRHMGDPDSEEILGLVGKGLTYDTGGYSLKPTDSMKTMQSDMGGAAAVIGAMYAMAKNNVAKNIVAVVAACENAISGGSYKPGDIIGSMAGKTIEVLNTDAEGRLTLADAMTYIIEIEQVTEVIDVATLTGAALVALGTSTSAVVTNDQEFYNRLVTASEKTGEQFWQLPAHKEYAKMNKSEVADLKNIGGRYAGTITAGLFVGEFNQGLPWMHLDIAGTAWAEANDGYNLKGGTGVPVRTLYGLVQGPCACGKH